MVLDFQLVVLFSRVMPSSVLEFLYFQKGCFNKRSTGEIRNVVLLYFMRVRAAHNEGIHELEKAHSGISMKSR